MKRSVLLLMILLVMLAIFAGCAEENPKREQMAGPGKETSAAKPDTPTDESTIPTVEAPADNTVPAEPEAPKLNGDVIASSIISEGYAVVCCDKESGVYYGIDLEGRVKFELNLSSDYNIRDLPRCEFVNGLMKIDGGLCDVDGNLTYPDMVGATNFYIQDLEDGYIFADVITSDFEGTKSEMGIMDTSLNWVVEPSEELYHALEYQNQTVFAFSTGRHDGFYCQDGYLYVEKLELFVELKSGQILGKGDGPAEQPSYSWGRNMNKGYLDRNGAVMVDLSQYENVHYVGNFVNGIATVVFYNREAKQHFVTAINENGAFLFDPVAFSEQGKGYGNVWSATDGQHIIAYEAYNGCDGIVRVYDLEGNLCGEMDAESLSDNNLNVSIEEGVVVFRMHTAYGQMDVWMFTPEFEELY